MMTKTIKLLVLQGLPASGKSTYAKKLCKDNPNTWVRVCRDDIRSMLGTYWVPSREKLVTELELRNIFISLSKGYNVVVDATNLNKKTLLKLHSKAREIENFYSTFANPPEKVTVVVEFKEFKTPLWKCLYRDWKRGFLGGRKVGNKVIRNFYNKYYDN